MNEVYTYRDRRRAELAMQRRSINAYRRGKCSQFELRQLGDSGGLVGGYPGELQRRFPTWRIIGQWSAGYRVPQERGN
jgi:hypothetical protein